MAKRIPVDKLVSRKTPRLLKELPDGTYRLTKLGARQNMLWHHRSLVKDGESSIGRLSVINRKGGPALVLDGWYGIITSWVKDVTKCDGYLEIHTENSDYSLEGPLFEEGSK